MTTKLAEFCRDDLLAQSFFKASQRRRNMGYRTSIAGLKKCQS